MREEDVLKFPAARTNLYGTNLDFQITWKMLLLAAHASVAIKHPDDVSVISSRSSGQQAVLKFVAAAPGGTPIAIRAAFWEPRLLVVTDPRADYQPLTVASYVNLPAIALCNTDSPLCCMDIANPCNKGAHSVGLIWGLLAREVLCICGTTYHKHSWEQANAEKAVTQEEFRSEWTAPAPTFTATQPEVTDRSEGMQVPSVSIQQFPTEDWSAQPAPILNLLEHHFFKDRNY
ncbi:unnamed protein product [Nyctereutes procyonoides]|uniref:(raccoon dog) hypothetical protein n=1 Tax=Nyctereutes procyonoides TaxID=34880 RepID=A0A811YPT1_NYCPR|nr:unnamed protein product [Nyctereutes procyonoides]